ncbi:hypothetical protein ACOAKC_08265 [Hathewaya histolytica]|uniref:hypothetical protein n=1 Tax=Hathewaya histolytica TaxID=1498 RepID=UPI003B682898
MENIKKAFVGQVNHFYWCRYFGGNGFLSYKKIISFFNEIFYGTFYKFYEKYIIGLTLGH